MRGAHKFMAALAAVMIAASVGGCSTWDSMSQTQKGTAVGVGVGGVAGAAVSGGDPLSTVGGAAVGGVVGHEVGKKR